MLSWIVCSVSKNLLSQIVGSQSARTAWNSLVAAYSSGSRAQIHTLKHQLFNLRRGNESITDYIQSAKFLADCLASLQSPVSDDDLVSYMIEGLGPSYRPFVCALEAWLDAVSFDDLFGLLLSEEMQLVRDETPVEPLNVSRQNNNFRGGRNGRGRGRGRDHSVSRGE